MKTHQITGIGPQAADGGVDLFTVRPTPFHVTKEWLDAQAAYPVVGQDIVEAEDGSLSLSAVDAPPSVEEAQKKTMAGSEGSADGSQVSQLPSYSSKPTTIQAGKIIEVQPHIDETNPDSIVTLEDNTQRVLPKGNICGVGDYWCTDGAYEWFMPAAMFADKFAV